MASLCPGIVHHLSGPSMYAPTPCSWDLPRNLGNGRPRDMYCLSGRQAILNRRKSLSLRIRVCHPYTRIHVRLLGPCFKTGRLQAIPPAMPLAPQEGLPVHTRLDTYNKVKPLKDKTAGKASPKRRTLDGPSYADLNRFSRNNFTPFDSLHRVLFHLSLAVLVLYRSLACI